MRVLGLDYGDKTVGLAISDPFGWTAQPLEIIRRKDENALKPTIARLKEIVAEYSVDTLVLGFPKNLNNSLGFRCEKTLAFKSMLEKHFNGIPVILWDERLSTVGAERILLSADLSRQKRKDVIDKMAASYFLQSYLDSLPKELSLGDKF